MKLIFFGTPDFAATSLQAIVNAGFNVVAVVTSPDKPAGRGLKTTPSEVKIQAAQIGLPILQPEKLKDPDFLSLLDFYHADIYVVIAFRMLPEIIWNKPRLGTINLHASLLPAYRGAAPINHAIINGETSTGLTTFFLKHEIDTGEIIMQSKVSIGQNETAGELHDRMKITGSLLMVETLQHIKNNTYTLTPQPIAGEYPKAPKIFSKDCKIYWNQPVQVIYNFIRGLSPYPGAYTFFQNSMVKIYKSHFTEQTANLMEPGTFEITDNLLKVHCQNGFIYIDELQLQGKKRMSVNLFILGFRPEIYNFN